MKKILKSKVTVVILACLLLVGVFAGVTVLANSAPTLKISYANVEYGGQAQIVYGIDSTVTTDGIEDSMEMYFWGSYPTEENKNSPEATSKVEYNTAENARTPFVATSRGFAPYEMTQVVYAQVVYNAGEENESRSPVNRYSIFEYICASLGNGGTELDERLWTAMSDYITYAQKYLGWTENSSPEQLAYVQVTNGYLPAKDNSGAQYSSGVYLNTGVYTLVAGMDQSRFASWYRYDIDKYVNTKYSYSPDATEAYRHYVAVYNANVNVTNGSAVSVENNSGNGYVAVGDAVSGEATPATLTTKSNTVLLYAPIYKTVGETKVYFEKWVDAAGDTVSNNASFTFDVWADLLNQETELKTYDFKAVYTETVPTSVSDIEWNGTGVTSKNENGTLQNTVTETEGGFTNVTYKPVSINPEGGWQTGGSICTSGATSSATALPKTILISTDVCIGPNVEDTDGVPHVTDYMVQWHDNGVVYQYGIGTSAGGNRFGNFAYRLVKEEDSQELLGYYIGMQNDGGFTRTYFFDKNNVGLLDFGQTYNVTYEIVLNNNGSNYSMSAVNLYIDGVYAGTGTINVNTSVPANGNVYVQYTVQWRTNCTLTVTNGKLYEK